MHIFFACNNVIFSLKKGKHEQAAKLSEPITLPLMNALTLNDVLFNYSYAAPSHL